MCGVRARLAYESDGLLEVKQPGTWLEGYAIIGRSGKPDCIFSKDEWLKVLESATSDHYEDFYVLVYGPVPWIATPTPGLIRAEGFLYPPLFTGTAGGGMEGQGRTTP